MPKIRQRLHLGPLVTHNQCVTSDAVATYAFPLARACWEVGAPQIRNRATVAGNVITASPANDTIVPLLALDATVTLASAARGERSLPLASFMTDFRHVNLADDEILTRISIPKLEAGSAPARFIKLGLRRAQAISVVNVAVIMAMDVQDRVVDARIALGAVAPVIVRAAAAETYLLEKALDDEVIAEAARRSLAAAQPIDDLRGSAGYRLAMVEELVKRASDPTARRPRTRRLASAAGYLAWSYRRAVAGCARERTAGQCSVGQWTAGYAGRRHEPAGQPPRRRLCRR